LNEKNVSTQQSQAQENPWIFGEDEYEERSKRLKTEAKEGEKKAKRLNPKFLRTVNGSIQPITDDEDHRERILQIYKKGADHSTSGFQKGDEIRKEDFLSKLCRLRAEK
jgi:hypothetical protein